MPKTQLNFNIDPNLLAELKSKAMMSGKTLGSFLNEIITKSLNEHHDSTLSFRLNQMEARIHELERKLGEYTKPGQKITPFTDKEAINCTYFMRELFKVVSNYREPTRKKEAWDQLLSHIACFDQWNDLYTLRLKEVLMMDDGDPWTAKELNNLTTGKACPCPIRTGLINWVNKQEKGQCSCDNDQFPSQQEICDKGIKLIPLVMERVSNGSFVEAK